MDPNVEREFSPHSVAQESLVREWRSAIVDDLKPDERIGIGQWGHRAAPGLHPTFGGQAVLHRGADADRNRRIDPIVQLVYREDLKRISVFDHDCFAVSSHKINAILRTYG